MNSTVHFLPWQKISMLADWLTAIGCADHVRANDFVACKIHFGEEGNTGYIRPQYAKLLADRVKEKNGKPFFTDASTIYVGQRADAYHHTLVAHRHGFTIDALGAPVIMADGLRGNAGVDVPVNLKHFKTVHIANAIHFADSLIFLNHFKGHEISGFGAALKNIGMGCGTRAGKYAMHDRVNPQVNTATCIGCGVCTQWCSPGALSVVNRKIQYDPQKCIGCGECILACAHRVFSIPWDENVSTTQEKIVEYCAGVLRNKRHFHITFMNHITRYCDCYRDTGTPVLADIGVIASTDPVAADQACLDLANKAHGGDFCRSIFPEIDCTVQLAYAERLNLGSRAYTLETA